MVYANTCAEWMTSAIAAFKHSLAVVTIYTNLGEEGVEHGLMQTQAAIIVTSHDLLPRLTKVPITSHNMQLSECLLTALVMTLQVLPRCPSARHVVIIPGHKPSAAPEPVAEVTFQPLEAVLARGRGRGRDTSTVAGAGAAPSPATTAIIMYTSGSTGVPKVTWKPYSTFK